MKDVIVAAEKSKKNKGLLAMKNIDKTAIAKVAKVLNIIDLSNKDNYAISNADINAVGD